MASDFLGAGFAFPFGVTARGKLAWARAEQRIEESIYLILATRLGERLMLPQFGCAVHDSLFAPNGPATRTRAVDSVRRALVAWEPRIDVLDVSAEEDPAEPSLLLLRINYRIRANNALANLVYPFYLNESS
ncbi:GPW/gp25 family protein [Chitinimonas lacunae]|uniref:GPW/gp25 family protein n=1 Tax=Chitinimonas lacunae TaxID=1963018 RepID=A0ABV8MMT7_9NEIS